MITGGVLWNHGVWPQTTPGGAATPPTPPPPPATVPDPPTDVNATPGHAEAAVFFTPPVNDGGAAITLYTVTSDPDGIVATGTSSPITVSYLANNRAYTFTVVATNSIGDSEASVASNSITTPVPDLTAPTITGINTLTTSLIVTFTAPTSFGTITNYEYSLDNGHTFTALLPVDTSSPITIPSLIPTTAYTVSIRAINNVPSTGYSSNVVAVTTASQQKTETFTTVGETTWTAPANVRYVQYLCAAGGGGGGAAYSKIIELGNVPVLTASAPKPSTGYWIYDGVNTSNYWGNRLYYGSNTNGSGGASTFPVPVRVTASADSGFVSTVKWYGGKELVYYLLPNTNGAPYPRRSNSFTGAFPDNRNNRVSGGGGGGAGGQIKGIFSATGFYSVVPRTPYTVIVGDGGDGGVGGPDSETAGAKGGDSIFDTIISEGGSGGQPSRDLTYNEVGFSRGGKGRTVDDLLLGGYGGGQGGGAGNATSGGFPGSGSPGGPNFPGTYGGGGYGGAPDTVATGTTTPNTGNGGAGTGATLNSYASGIKGGSGVVIVKYYI